MRDEFQHLLPSSPSAIYHLFRLVAAIFLLWLAHITSPGGVEALARKFSHHSEVFGNDGQGQSFIGNHCCHFYTEFVRCRSYPNPLYKPCSRSMGTYGVEAAFR